MSEFDLDLVEEAEEAPFNRERFVRILRYTKPYMKTVVLSASLTLCGIAINLAEPLLLRSAIDKGIAARDTATLVRIIGILLALRIINLFTQRTQIRTVNFLGQRILYDLRQELFTHVESLPFSFFDHRPVGKIISRLTNDVNHIGNLAASGVVNLASQLVSLVAIVAIMLAMHWKMALVSFTSLPLLFLVLTKVRWALESAWGDTRKAVGEINAHLNETVQGLQVIQAFGRERLNSGKFSVANRKYFGAYMKATKIDQTFWPLADLVGAIGTCTVVAYGASLVIKGEISLGFILAFESYLGKFWGPFNTFSRVWSQILSAMASAERVFGILDQPTESEEAGNVRVELPRIAGEVVFDHVTFGYRTDNPVLHDVSFTVKPGETIALVGPTGAGKTTIINLLARFYLPTEGKVLVDGYDLREVDLASYRSQLGIVLQDTFIFSGTVLDNLKFGRLDATMEEVERAVEAAYAKGFIEDMPDKYLSEVKERGTNLSTGQRQLLAFARALLADPRILILDEATSSIDPETERLIQKAIKALLKGRTAFIIAHRLSTVRAADRIMVIDGGKIAEQGTHEELVAAGGIYAKLYEAQFRKAS
ncbi:MAG TPA: ABC transporter ATP-binding protein [Firmicutes bacterium]|nr:ABC transporter ATP-binding protein [Candidatus Fermentithermobacillaceae bacterium]